MQIVMEAAIRWQFANLEMCVDGFHEVCRRFSCVLFVARFLFALPIQAVLFLTNWCGTKHARLPKAPQLRDKCVKC